MKWGVSPSFKTRVIWRLLLGVVLVFLVNPGPAIAGKPKTTKVAAQKAPRPALIDLLVSLFTSPKELAMELQLDDTFADLVQRLPGAGASLQQLAGATVSLLEKRGLLDAGFFDFLRRSRPGRAADIAQVARQWPATTTRRPSQRTGTNVDALVKLLTSIFVEGELAQFVTFSDRYSVFAADLPGKGASQAKVAAAVVKQLQARKLLDRSLFDALKRERPGRSEDIAAVERLWAPFPGERSAKGSGKSAPTQAAASPPKKTSVATKDAKVAGPTRQTSARCQQLTDFFSKFGDSDLRRFAFHDDRLRALPRALPSRPASSRQVGSALSAALLQRSLLDADFMHLLQALVPGRADEIATVFATCAGRPIGPGAARTSKTLELEKLLLSCFPSASDLGMFLQDDDRLSALTPSLPHQASLTEQVDELIRLLMRRTWVDATFFKSMGEKRPGRADDIARVQRAWLGGGS
jgi:hypothetical protein